MSEIFGNGIMGGGGLTNSKLALANAQAADVRSGKKFYAGDKQIKTGTLADVTQATPAITVDAAGKITASATQAAGVVAAGTKSATKQLPVQAAKTVIPSASAQTAVGEGVFTTGIVTVAAVYAVIGVTYPSGSVCTCTNGTLTLTAKDTSGKALFVIPSAGTWTVTAVSGSKSTSKTVSINAEGQAETVTLMFELVLFDGSNGGDVTALTGGWEADGHVSSNIVFSVGSDRISFNYAITQTQGTIKRTWFIYTKNSINMANYTTLHITFATMSGGDKWGIGVNTEIPSDFYSDNPSLTAKTATTTIKNNQTLTLSISNISKGYVMAYVSKSFDGSISMACDITRVWLE